MSNSMMIVMFRDKTREILRFGCRITLGGVLLFAAVSKFVWPAEAVAFLSRLLIPTDIVNSVYYVIVFLELLVGVLCVMGILSSHSLRSASFLYVCFSVIIAYALLSRVSGSCGCFGNVVTSDISILSVVRNLFLSLAALGLSRAKPHPYSVDNLVSRFISQVGDPRNQVHLPERA